MIITRTPLRVSFFGGGSDLPRFWRGGDGVGAVVSAAIDKYVWIAVNGKFDGKVRVSYSVTENVDRPGDLEHDLVREALATVGLPFGERGVEVVSVGDVPSGSGLGSSGAYAVGLLNALHAHRGARAGAERLAREACRLEVERCGRPVGYQDQYAAAFGGLNYIRFGPRGAVNVRPVRCPEGTLERLERRLLLLHLGGARKADEVLRGYEADRGVLEELASLASWMAGRLEAGDLDGFGAALSKGWRLKRRLSDGVSTDEIDALYRRALDSGAEGGKVCGAGGGGFLLLYAPGERRREGVARGLGLRRVPFRFERRGSEVIYASD